MTLTAKKAMRYNFIAGVLMELKNLRYSENSRGLIYEDSLGRVVMWNPLNYENQAFDLLNKIGEDVYIQVSTDVEQCLISVDSLSIEIRLEGNLSKERFCMLVVLLAIEMYMIDRMIAEGIPVSGDY